MSYFENKEEINDIVEILKKYDFKKTYDEKNSEKLAYTKNKIEIYFDRGNAYISFGKHRRGEFKTEDLKPLVFLASNKTYYTFIEKYLVKNRDVQNIDFSTFEEKLNYLANTDNYEHYKTKEKARKMFNEYKDFNL